MAFFIYHGVSISHSNMQGKNIRILEEYQKSELLTVAKSTQDIY